MKITLMDIKAFFSKDARTISVKEMKALSAADKDELKALLVEELASV